MKIKTVSMDIIYLPYKLMKKKGFGAVIMEVQRNIKPNIKFLKAIRNFCSKNNIVLIFDECSSGFREVLGGVHKKTQKGDFEKNIIKKGGVKC